MFSKIINWIKNFFQDSEEGKTKKRKKQKPGQCYYCNNKFKSFADKFNCRYCEHSHCSEHRLPEDHNCIGDPKNPFEMIINENLTKT